MLFNKPSRVTLKDLFIQSMENKILSGELKIGERLPSERELAEQRGMSKTAVHAGIVELMRKGFLEVIPRKGIFVGDYAKNGSLETLISLMHHNGGQLDSRNIRSVLEMRYAIESVALTHIVTEQKPEVLEALGAIVSEAEKLSRKKPFTHSTRLSELYFSFHHLICVASGNTIAPLIINAFRIPALHLWENSVHTLGPEESVGRLSQLYALIRSGDCAASCNYLKWLMDTSDTLVGD
jgi:DNA-binding FadR family transcriptional regulator